MADADRLLPEDRLTLHIEIEILLKDVDSVATAANWPLATTAQYSTDNLEGSMLEEFVDIPASVLLIFADGEQRCHTFPLVAREKNVRNWPEFFFTVVIARLQG
jgi:hypothetical protein